MFNKQNTASKSVVNMISKKKVNLNLIFELNELMVVNRSHWIIIRLQFWTKDNLIRNVSMGFGGIYGGGGGCGERKRIHV